MRLEGVEVGDDHFHGFTREAAGRFVDGTSLWRWITEQAIDFGFASMASGPHASREGHLYDASGVGQSHLRSLVEESYLMPWT